MATNLQFIKEVSGTTIATIKAEDIFSSNFDVYFIELEIEGTTTYNEIYLLDSNNNRLNHSTDDDEYDSALLVMKSNTTFADHQQSNTYVGWRELGVYVDNSGDGYGMSMYVYNPYSSSSYTFVTAQSAGMVGANLWGGKAIGTFTKAIQCNGLEFANSGGGNMNYIKASIYGVK